MIFLIFQKGQPVHREILADLCWSDRADPQARASLRQSLLELRSALGPAAKTLLAVDRRHAGLNFSALDTDLWTRDGELSLEVGAPLLDGLGAISPVFDDWLDQERSHIRTRQAQTAERLIGRGAPGDDDVLTAAEFLLALEPENEVAARAAILGYGLRQSYSRAKQVFNAISEALEAEGLDVSQSTVDVYRDIGPTPAAAPLARPPPPTPPQAQMPHGAAALRSGPPRVHFRAFQCVGPLGDFRIDYVRAALETRCGDVAEMVCLSGEDAAEAESASVDYVILGTFAPEPSGIRVTMRAVAQGGEQIGTFSAQLAPPHALEEVSRCVDRIIAWLLPSVERHEVKRLSGHPESSFGPYHHYLRGKSIIMMAEREDYMDRAEPHLQRAVDAAPDFLPPYPYLISSLNSGRRATRPGLSGADDRATALNLARRLLLRDARNPNAHLALAWCLIRQEQFDLAEQALMKAGTFRPYEANRINSIGTAYVVLGDLDLGETYYALARDLMVHDIDYMNTDLGELYYLRNDYAKALTYLNLGELRNPNYARCLRSAALAQLGRLDEAQGEADAVLAHFQRRWSGSAPFSARAAIRWFIGDLCFRRQVDLDNIVEGLSKAGFPV